MEHSQDRHKQLTTSNTTLQPKLMTTSTDSNSQIEDSSLSLDFTRYHPSFHADLIDFIARTTSLLPLHMPQPSPSISITATAGETHESATVLPVSTATLHIKEEVDNTLDTRQQ